MHKFNNVLKRTELPKLIQFSDEVTSKIEYVEFLEKLIYSDISKHVKERSQLHKILEDYLWIFGERYNDSTRLLSDKNLQNNLKELRDKVLPYKYSKKADNRVEIKSTKAKSITDLFLYSEKIISDTKKEVLVIELKAPKVKISPKELQQAKNYAYEIQDSPQFSQEINYTIILISSDINKKAQFEIDGARQSDNDPDLFLLNELRNIKIKVIKWSVLLERLKRKLKFMSRQLEIKDKGIKDKIEDDFTHLELSELTSRLRKIS